MEFEISELSNGLKVVHRQTDRPVAHCGLFIPAGSRDENPDEQGLAHFLEHCLFKGTKKRRAYHVLSRLEDVGGELSAYTTKEETVIHCSFLNSYYARAIELIADISLNSTFPEREIAKEKEVIVDEIYSYKDNPGESIFDDFEELIFAGHPLGNNILGSVESVRQLGRNDLMNFINRHYRPEKMVFSSVGNIGMEHLCKLLEKHLQDYAHKQQQPVRLAVNGYQPKSLETKRPAYQTHAIIGTRAYPAQDENSRVLLLLSNLLGGPGMNSRLNLNIREKFGFTYHLESFYQPYSDTGLFGIYLGTDPGTVKKVIRLVHRELTKLREKKLGTLQLSKAKKQLLGQIALAQENNNAMMLAYGKSLMSFNKIDDFATVQQKIEAITADELQAVAREIFAPAQLSSLIYRPENANHGIS